LFSIRTGQKTGDGKGDGYQKDMLEDPDAKLSPEEWQKKYGEETDTSVLYDEKVCRPTLHNVKDGVMLAVVLASPHAGSPMDLP
jgi:hypothetical protein